MIFLIKNLKTSIGNFVALFGMSLRRILLVRTMVGRTCGSTFSANSHNLENALDQGALVHCYHI